MPVLLAVIVVAICVAFWVRAVRERRRRWLLRLDLPGVWLWQDEDGELEFDGGVDRGRYRIRDRQQEERGAWRLQGHSLTLAPEAPGPAAILDLRMFKEGTIGLDGPGRERRTYVKKRGNVVPLRRPA